MTAPRARREGDINEKRAAAAAKAAAANDSTLSGPLAAIATPLTPTDPSAKATGLFGPGGFGGYIRDYSCPPDGLRKNIYLGIPVLDGPRGIAPGQLVVLGGRPGSGKTAAKEQCERYVAATGQVLCISLEMTGWETQCRHLAALSGLDCEAVIARDLREDQILALETAANANMGALGNLHVLKKCTDVLGDIEAWIAVNGVPELVTLDYLQRATPVGSQPQHAALDELVHALVDLAERHNTVILALSQLNRESLRNDRPVCAADLAGSDTIERAAGLIALIDHKKGVFPRPDDGTVDRTIKIEKRRGGREGVSQVMRFHGPTLTFRNGDPATAVPASGPKPALSILDPK